MATTLVARVHLWEDTSVAGCFAKVVYPEVHLGKHRLGAFT